MGKERVEVASQFQTFHMKQFANVLKPQIAGRAGLFRILYALLNVLSMARRKWNVRGTMAMLC